MPPKPVTHEDIDARLQRGDDRFASIEEALAKIAASVEPIPAMRADISATKEIVEAWTTAKNLARFIKWAGAIAAAMAAIFVMMKAGAQAFAEWGKP